MVKLANTTDSKSVACKGLRVQLPLSAPLRKLQVLKVRLASLGD